MIAGGKTSLATANHDCIHMLYGFFTTHHGLLQIVVHTLFVSLVSAHVPSCLVQSFLGNDATRQSSDSMRQTGKTSAAGGDSHQVGELRGMLQTLERLGYDLDSLLTSVGMQRGDVENSTAYISPRACSMVFARANEEG